MFARPGSRIITSLVVGLFTLGAASGRAAADCASISGKLSVQPTSGASCSLPFSFCASLEFTGGFKGTSQFTSSQFLSGFTASNATGTASVSVLDGPVNAIHTRDGDITKIDVLTIANVVAVGASGEWEFTLTEIALGGTGAWANAIGVITARGSFDPTTGGSGRFEGEICTP